MQQINTFYVIKRNDSCYLRLDYDRHGEEVTEFVHDVLIADKYDDINKALQELKYYPNCEVVEMATMEGCHAEMLKNAIIPPKGFMLHQTVYMIPTEFNRLKKITAYEILDFSLSSIGERAGLSICKKQRGIESLYCASFDMFNESIFATEIEATQKYSEIQQNKLGGAQSATS